MEYFFVTKIGDEVVGFVRAVEVGQGTLRVTMFRMAMEWHHTSVPGSLLRNMHGFCCHSGFSTVVFEAGAVPPVAQRMLETCGFRPQDRQRKVYAIVPRKERILGVQA
jgi:hypothetical protein